MANDKLTDKQLKFAQFVASGETYADAYRKAYNCSKMTNNSIWINSSKLMADAKVSLRVDKLRQETLKRNQVTIDEVLNELANWIRFDPLTIIDEDTDCVKKLKDMSKESRMSLAEIQVSEIWGSVQGADGKKHREQIGELKKIKFIDKRAVAEMFMKKFGQYVQESSGIESNLDAIREIIKEIKK